MLVGVDGVTYIQFNDIDQSMLVTLNDLTKRQEADISNSKLPDPIFLVTPTEMSSFHSDVSETRTNFLPLQASYSVDYPDASSHMSMSGTSQDMAAKCDEHRQDPAKQAKTKSRTRPCKHKRMRFRQFVDSLKESYRQNPETFDLNSLTVPESITWDDTTQTKVKNLLVKFIHGQSQDMEDEGRMCL